MLNFCQITMITAAELLQHISKQKPITRGCAHVR